MTATVSPFQTLDAVFDVHPTQLPSITTKSDVAVVADTPLDEVPTQDHLKEDYALARQTLRSLLEKGETVVDNMINIATVTESPRGFEVASNLIKTMSDLAKDLMALHKATNDAKGAKASKKEATVTEVVNQQNVQNNITFSGSTSEMLAMYKRMKEGSTDEEVINIGDAGSN